MILYLVRHGETRANVDPTIEFQLPEEPLSPIGKKQAKFLAKRFSKIPIDVIISSDYARAKETAQIISEAIDRPVIHNKLLREIPHVYDWQKPEQYYPTIEKQIKKFFKHIEKRKEKHVLAIAHAIIIKSMIHTLLYPSNENVLQTLRFFSLKNTGITILEHNDDMWRLKVWNDHSHLG